MNRSLKQFVSKYLPDTDHTSGIHQNRTSKASRVASAMRSLMTNATHHIHSPSENNKPSPDRDAVLAIDISDSMNEAGYGTIKIAAARKVAIKFVQTLKKHHCHHRVGIVLFNNTGCIALPLTPASESRICVSAIKPIRAGGMTNLADGLAKSLQLLSMSNATREVYVLADGADNCNGDPIKVAELLKDQGIYIDCTGIGESPASVDEVALRKIASKLSSGKAAYRFIGDKQASELVRHFENAGRGISRQ